MIEKNSQRMKDCPNCRKELGSQNVTVYPFNCWCCNIVLYNQSRYNKIHLCYCKDEEIMLCQKCYFVRHMRLIERKGKLTGGSMIVEAILPCFEVIKLSELK